MLKRLFPLLAAVLLSAILNPHLNAGEIRMLVADFNARGVSKDVSMMVTEWVRTAVTNSDYTIVDRSKMNEIMSQHEIQMTGLVDEKNAVKIGKLLSANKILAGTVSKIGSKYVISGRLIDAEKGVASFGHNEFTWNISDLDFCTQRFCDNMIKKMSGKYQEPEKTRIKAAISSEYNPEEEKKQVLKTVKTMFDAYSNKDIEAYLTYIDENARFWCSSYDLKGISSIRKYRETVTFKKYDNFRYKLKNVSISIQGNTATMYDTYVLKFVVKSNGRQITESARERYKLVKRGNSWYILENQEY
ncbi:MAG: DUF4440 domain-containing protein [Spirochaetota bacterium]